MHTVLTNKTRERKGTGLAPTHAKIRTNYKNIQYEKHAVSSIYIHTNKTKVPTVLSQDEKEEPCANGADPALYKRVTL